MRERQRLRHVSLLVSAQGLQQDATLQSLVEALARESESKAKVRTTLEEVSAAIARWDDLLQRGPIDPHLLQVSNSDLQRLEAAASNARVRHREDERSVVEGRARCAIAQAKAQCLRALAKRLRRDILHDGDERALLDAEDRLTSTWARR